MKEIVKHINDTNASFRALTAGDAKNTDLFLDNEHYELFKNEGEQITVRFSKENLQKAILFISSILPRKYDSSSVHKQIPFSWDFVVEQMKILDSFFLSDGKPIENRTQVWNARKDVKQKNGKIDNRFYFNGLIEEFEYLDAQGDIKKAKFTIRNYLAGGFSELHIKKNDDGIFDVWITNILESFNDGKEDLLEDLEDPKVLSLQVIYFGAPGTGKSHAVEQITNKNNSIRTTFHPDSDYSTFVGCYKPIKKTDGSNEITYDFVPQAFTQAYIKAWKNLCEPFYLVIEEINRGNCAQIFGDIFQLLDRDSDTGYSNYKITPDQDLQMYLANEFANTEIEDEEIKNGVKMQLPGNLHILATMNTSDQSLFPIDSAFKRRWDWKYIPIDYTDLGHYITCGDKKYKWIDFLTEVNKRIEAVTQSEDKKLGAWFVKAVNKEISAEKFVSKVVFYLWNDIYKDFAHDASTIFKDEFDKFHKFFDFKGDVKLDVLDEFFESLEILYFTDDEESVSDKEDSDSKSHLIVQFPDGTKISENTRFETYQKALKIIGLEKAEQVASTMKYKRLNSPLISKTKSENILNNTQGYLYIEDGDFNIIKGINTRTMRRFLMQISDTYNLGINCVVE